MRPVRVLVLWSTLLVLLGCGSAGPAPTPTITAGFTNPVWDSNFPDPMIIDGGDGAYWAFATNGNGANVQTLRSTDLVSWEQGPDALPELPEWTSPGDVWAPEVIEHDGRFLMYYTTRAPAGDIQCVSLAVAARPEGPYRDRRSGPLVCERKAGGTIDPHPFVTPGSRCTGWTRPGRSSWAGPSGCSSRTSAGRGIWSRGRSSGRSPAGS